MIKRLPVRTVLRLSVGASVFAAALALLLAVFENWWPALVLLSVALWFAVDALRCRRWLRQP